MCVVYPFNSSVFNACKSIQYSACIEWMCMHQIDLHEWNGCACIQYVDTLVTYDDSDLIELIP